MLPTTLETYGAPFLDERPVDNPETQTSADLYNRKCEDVAQMTRTGYRAIVRFTPTAAAAPVAVTVDTHWSVWGSSDTQKPSIQKTATGIYEVTYAASYVDGLSESESVGFVCAHASLEGPTSGVARVSVVTSNVITVEVEGTTFVNSDITSDKVVVWIR